MINDAYVYILYNIYVCVCVPYRSKRCDFSPSRLGSTVSLLIGQFHILGFVWKWGMPPPNQSKWPLRWEKCLQSRGRVPYFWTNMDLPPTPNPPPQAPPQPWPLWGTSPSWRPVALAYRPATAACDPCSSPPRRGHQRRKPRSRRLAPHQKPARIRGPIRLMHVDENMHVLYIYTYITSHYITLHCIYNCITLHYIKLHYITLHTYLSTYIHYTTLRYIALHLHLHLHCITCITLHYIHYITLHTYIHMHVYLSYLCSRVFI